MKNLLEISRYEAKELDSMNRNNPEVGKERTKLGLILCGAVGFASIAIVALTTPFILPALRKHCLPYIPATDNQILNLNTAFRRHAKKGSSFIDIGSGDGRICRLAAKQNLFSKVHGVELNYMLVLLSRFFAIRNGSYRLTRYFHADLWKFPLHDYDSICIFGVESMMKPLENYLKKSRAKSQTVFACRFPFVDLTATHEIGEGIDTVWVYKLNDGHINQEKK